MVSKSPCLFAPVRSLTYGALPICTCAQSHIGSFAHLHMCAVSHTELCLFAALGALPICTCAWSHIWSLNYLRMCAVSHWELFTSTHVRSLTCGALLICVCAQCHIGTQSGVEQHSSLKWFRLMLSEPSDGNLKLFAMLT